MGAQWMQAIYLNLLLEMEACVVLAPLLIKNLQITFEKDRALVRRFQKIDIKEPTKDETIKILSGLKSYYESYHKIKYTSDAIISSS